jgi:tetratricopeptide (TPR) repeat protein
MRKAGLSISILLFIVPLTWLWLLGSPEAASVRTEAEPAAISAEGHAGSVSCRECHENFYQLWSTSRHGLAMQPFTAEFASDELEVPSDVFEISGARYRAEFADGIGWVREDGPQGEFSHRIEHAMGGKNVYFFLTELERGHLQVLPLAYDVASAEWYHTTKSMIRHVADEAVDWRDRSLTFNTSCHSCHVSQLSTNYDLECDSYHTTWAEPGINCETCHGSAQEHVRLFESASPGEVPEDPRVIRTGEFDVDQTNSMCSVCHAVMNPLTTSYQPGEEFFDHFNLTAFESPDFYPDGRDLGENYTYTLWLTNPCVRSGQMDCLHCHTSSGRFRFADEPNQTCAPCHGERVASPTDHTRHAPDSPGNLCISCHMPQTEFARMRRSDHSLRPPTPAATIAHGSPNACNLCHTDQSPEWADEWVRQWRERDYQAPVLHRAGLIADARERDWSRLPDMLAYLEDEDNDPVFAASLIRLLAACDDERKSPVLIAALNDPSPLVRSAAADGLAFARDADSVRALLRATEDDLRVVRIMAARSLSAVPVSLLDDEVRMRIERATEELEASLLVRPDDWASHYNRGNYHLDRAEVNEALAAYATALGLNPKAVPVMANAAMVWARMGEPSKAETMLRHALAIEPESDVVNFNLGLLLAELGSPEQAESRLRRALETDPNLAAAAFNLGVLIAEDRPEEALEWSRRATELRPHDLRYAHTLAFYLHRGGESEEATQILEGLIEETPGSVDAHMLLGEIHEQVGDLKAARSVYQRAIAEESVPPQVRLWFEARLQFLSED